MKLSQRNPALFILCFSLFLYSCKNDKIDTGPILKQLKGRWELLHSKQWLGDSIISPSKAGHQKSIIFTDDGDCKIFVDGIEKESHKFTLKKGIKDPKWPLMITYDNNESQYLRVNDTLHLMDVGSNQMEDFYVKNYTVVEIVPEKHKSMILPALDSFISVTMPDWTVPPQDSWDKQWWDEYKKDSSLVNYLPGDFNCDGKKDYALILENKKGNLAAWAFIAKKDSFITMMLEQVPKDPGHINIGLEPLEKGNTGYFQGEKPMTKKVTCPGVTLNFFEQAAHSFYWEKGKMKTIQTGD